MDSENRRVAKEWLQQPGNNFCALPFVHMAVESNGDIRPCCMGEKFDINVKDYTLKEAFYHPDRMEFIESFKNNEQHPKCNACWNDNKSVRQKFSTSMPVALEVTIAAMNNEPVDPYLGWLEIKPGNRCNLKCRICGVHNSSQWTKEEYILSNSTGTYKESQEFLYTQSCNWIDNKEFWDNIEMLKEIRSLYFMGGEPFMVLEHLQLLRNLLKSNIDCSKIRIYYNTNGTYFPPEEVWELYANFEKVTFAISVDDIGDRFTYQRHPATWKEVTQNIISFREKEELYENIRWSLDPAINIFNIYYIDEIEKEFSNLGFKLSESCEHFVTGKFDCRNLPADIKSKLVSKVMSNNTSGWIINCCNFLISQPSDDIGLKRAFKSISQIDKLRNESFKDTFKEFYELLEPHWKKESSQDVGYRETDKGFGLNGNK